jgi:hypothetical protein
VLEGETIGEEGVFKGDLIVDDVEIEVDEETEEEREVLRL